MLWFVLCVGVLVGVYLVGRHYVLLTQQQLNKALAIHGESKEYRRVALLYQRKAERHERVAKLHHRQAKLALNTAKKNQGASRSLLDRTEQLLAVNKKDPRLLSDEAMQREAAGQCACEDCVDGGWRYD